ncbi:MAG: hypothetical protein Unbinned96contig1001_9 [Prokaryotic dsDNA virus sp.]|nr:MAG: hypothetical protein Unbinned96contig1001_9 [Prokaryotic dsDNA virus sp.]|tara:strand:- start:189 stop:389 length:201 start_codon:yes stop_codon:yes gene_type:complete
MNDLEKKLHTNLLETLLQEKEEMLYKISLKYGQHRDLVEECEEEGTRVEKEIEHLVRVLEALKYDS